MAELLIRATGHWMDKLSKEEVDKMTSDQKASYEARSQKGDVIVVRPDGWKWGKCECLPDYLIVKVKDTIDEAKKYEMPLEKEILVDGKTTSKMVKVRKHNIDIASVDKISLAVKDLEKVTPYILTTDEPIKTKEVSNG